MSKTISKTVRFDPDTFKKIQTAASDHKVCTSVYIRDLVSGAVSNIARSA